MNRFVLYLLSVTSIGFINQSGLAQQRIGVIYDPVVFHTEHREEARDLGGSKPWTDTISKPGAILYDYTFHEISRRGPGTNGMVSVKDNVITVTGKTGFEPLTGKGGNYEYQVTAIFLRLDKIAGEVTPLQLEKLIESRFSVTGKFDEKSKILDVQKASSTIFGKLSGEKKVSVTKFEISALPNGLGLIKGFSRPHTYIVVNNKRHHIKDEATLVALGLSFEQIKTISDVDLDKIPEANRVGPLLMSSASGTRATYELKSGVRRFIPDETTFVKLGYKFEEVLDLPPHLINLYPEATPLPSKK